MGKNCKYGVFQQVSHSHGSHADVFSFTVVRMPVSVLCCVPYISLSHTHVFLYIYSYIFFTAGSVVGAWHAGHRNAFPDFIIIKIIEASTPRLKGLCVHEHKGSVWFLPCSI